MTDEEKKAIETIKDFKNLKWYEHAFDNGTEVLEEEEKQDIDVVLNLIEKQSKKIEELSDKLTEKICKGVEEEILEEYRQTIISKDKEIEGLKEDNKKKSIGELIHIMNILM